MKKVTTIFTFIYLRALLPVSIWYGTQVYRAFKHLTISLGYFALTIGIVVVFVGTVNALTTPQTWQDYLSNISQLPNVVLEHITTTTEAQNNTAQGL